MHILKQLFGLAQNYLTSILILFWLPWTLISYSVELGPLSGGKEWGKVGLTKGSIGCLLFLVFRLLPAGICPGGQSGLELPIWSLEFKIVLWSHGYIFEIPNRIQAKYQKSSEIRF